MILNHGSTVELEQLGVHVYCHPGDLWTEHRTDWDQDRPQLAQLPTLMVSPISPELAAWAVLEIRGVGWNVAIASSTANCAVAAADNNLVVAAGLKALSLSGKEVGWVTELETPATDILTCTDEHIDLWTDLQVYRLSASDGSVIWRFDAPEVLLGVAVHPDAYELSLFEREPVRISCRDGQPVTRKV